PADRYATAGELADDLASWLRGGPVTPPPDRWWFQVGRAFRRHPVKGAFAVLVALAALSAPALLYYMDGQRPIRELERRLEAGERVELIGEKGWPRWVGWARGEEEAKTILSDGFYTVNTPRTALIDLVRDPRHARYRVTAQVKHRSG